MKQQHAQNRPIAYPFQGVGWRRLQQGAGLRITERRRLAFLAFDLGAPHAFYRVVGDRVGIA